MTTKDNFFYLVFIWTGLRQIWASVTRCGVRRTRRVRSRCSRLRAPQTRANACAAISLAVAPWGKCKCSPRPSWTSPQPKKSTRKTQNSTKKSNSSEKRYKLAKIRGKMNGKLTCSNFLRYIFLYSLIFLKNICHYIFSFQNESVMSLDWRRFTFFNSVPSATFSTISAEECATDSARPVYKYNI